ncbi:MAG: GerAB/ArcD/ProY family transporter [Halanaerobiaceae bacterium]
MIKKIKMSGVQYFFWIVGMVFGNTAFSHPTSNAYQDGWLSFIIAWTGGFLLMTLYILIYRLNPGETLVGILKNYFGKVIGTLFSILYLIYFFHLGTIGLRYSVEFLKTVTYFETPIIALAIAGTLTIAYVLKTGLEAIGRIGELIVPPVIVIIILIFTALISEYNIQNLLPFMSEGIKPILLVSFQTMSISFGQTVVFLMIFPYLNKEARLFKTSYAGIAVIGILLLLIVFQEIFVLGPDLVYRYIFPTQITARLLPAIDVDQLVAVSYVIGGGIKIVIVILAVLLGIAELFNFKEYIVFVLPICALMIVVSFWLFNNIFHLIDWNIEIFPYYSIPFQIVIPVIILILSILKKQIYR